MLRFNQANLTHIRGQSNKIKLENKENEINNSEIHPEKLFNNSNDVNSDFLSKSKYKSRMLIKNYERIKNLQVKRLVKFIGILTIWIPNYSK